MEMQLFDTELNMSPVDMSKIQETHEEGEETKKGEGLLDPKDVENEYTIIDVLSKSDKKEKGAEETEEEEESKKTEKKPASEQSADSSKFPYSTFTKALYEEGVISEFDDTKFKTLVEENDGSEVSALIELLRTEVEEGKQSIINNLSQEGKDFLDALEKGVPLDRYITLKSTESTLMNIKEESLEKDEELCKNIMREDLRLKGFDKDETEDQIKDADDLGKLKQKAKQALKKLQSVHSEAIKQEKLEAEKQQQARIEENKKTLANIKNAIEKTVEIIPGMKLNAKMKGELYDDITTPSKQLPNGTWVNATYAKRSEDPVAFDIKIAFLNRLGVFDGKWDKLIAKGKSAAVGELSEKLKTGDISKTGEPGNGAPTQTAKDILRSMEVFKSQKNN